MELDKYWTSLDFELRALEGLHAEQVAAARSKTFCRSATSTERRERLRRARVYWNSTLSLVTDKVLDDWNRYYYEYYSGWRGQGRFYFREPWYPCDWNGSSLSTGGLVDTFYQIARATSDALPLNGDIFRKVHS